MPDHLLVPADRHPTAIAIHEVLLADGPMNFDALREALGRRGIFVSNTEIDGHLDGGDLPMIFSVNIPKDETLVAVDGLLADRVFTHELSESEIESSLIALDPNLRVVMSALDGMPVKRLSDGTPIAELFAGPGVEPTGSLALPTDYLAEFAPGDLVGIRATASGLRIESVGEVGTPVEGIPELIAEMLNRDGATVPVMIDELIYRLCIAEPDLFREPLPPIGILLVTWGLDYSSEHVAPAGFDFGGWGVGSKVRHIASEYQINDDQALAVAALTTVFKDVLRMVELDSFDPDAVDFDLEESDDNAATAGDSSTGIDTAGQIAEVVKELIPQLADAAVAEAFFWETVGEGVQEAVALGALVETWEATASRQVQPALIWLRGRCLERLGKVLEAETAYEQSLSLDPFFESSLVDLSRYAADRGNAARAISLLERAGFDDDYEIIVGLKPFVPVDRSDVGRNDPCFCGSGRKYKRCHLGRSELDPKQQARWLWGKATSFAQESPHSELVFELADLHATAKGSELVDSLFDPTVLDVALYDGGVLAEFQQARGVLLPAQEQLILAAWLLIDRSVFEVTTIRPGRSVDLQDLRTGDTHEVADIALSTSVRQGELISTRLLPVGDAVEIHGGAEPVPLHLLDWTLDQLGDVGAQRDPYEMIQVLSARFAPPLLQNGDGDPLVGCSAQLELAGAEKTGLIQFLDSHFDQRGLDDTETRRWHFLAPGALGDRVLAVVALSGVRLTVESNTERRFDEVLDIIRAAAPASTVTSESRTPVEAMTLSGNSAEESPFADPADPAVAQVLAEVTADYERKWLDMEIPALAGLTPRQAAVDPTRREDLIRLLASFDLRPGGPGAMDPNRLRQSLDLPIPDGA